MTAAKEIEFWSATTRFHFLKGIIEYKGGGVIKGIWGLPSVIGSRILPVEVTWTREEYSVDVVVRTLTVEILLTAEDTKVATVGKEVVKTAFVIVLTGKELVGAVAVNKEMILP